ncbi:MAG: hypothetical protein AAF676_06720 [Pseudomonadota bacterium]
MVFDALLPGATRVTLHLEGGRLSEMDGAPLDEDGDGSAGGDFAVGFSTLSGTATPGTTLVGRVLDTGPDLRPMTTSSCGPSPGPRSMSSARAMWRRSSAAPTAASR